MAVVGWKKDQLIKLRDWDLEYTLHYLKHSEKFFGTTEDIFTILKNNVDPNFPNQKISIRLTPPSHLDFLTRFSNNLTWWS
jgi:hypothetical protein